MVKAQAGLFVVSEMAGKITVGGRFTRVMMTLSCTGDRSDSVSAGMSPWIPNSVGDAPVIAVSRVAIKTHVGPLAVTSVTARGNVHSDLHDQGVHLKGIKQIF